MGERPCQQVAMAEEEVVGLTLVEGWVAEDPEEELEVANLQEEEE